MELTFLGTCGEIDQRTRHHRRHSALLVRQAEVRTLIDGGAEIVGGDERVLGALVRRLGRERGVDARIACDGLRISLDR